MRKAVLVSALVAAVALTGCSTGAVDAEKVSKLSLSKLMALHVDEEADVDRQALEVALRAKLEDMSAMELFPLRKEANAEGLLCIDFIYNPLAKCVTDNSLVVHGKVIKVEYSRDDLIRDILARSMGGTGMTITLEVLGQYPRDPKRDTLTYETSASWEYTNFVREGHEYVFSFTLAGERVGGGGVTATYMVQNGAAHNIIDHAPTSLDEMWEIVESRHKLVSKGGAGGEAIEAWTKKLSEGSLEESRAALDILTQKPETTPAPGVVMDMLERHYVTVRKVLDAVPAHGNSSAEPQRRAFRSLAKKAVEILTQAGDAGAAGRMYAMYTKDVSTHAQPALSPDGDFDKDMTRMVGAAPCPERIERLKTLFTGKGVIKHGTGQSSYAFVERLYYPIRALEEAPGKEIDALLLDMNAHPKAHGFRSDLDLAAVWHVLAARGVMEVRPTLEKVMENPAVGDFGLQGGPTNNPAGSRRTYAVEALAELAKHMDRAEGYALALKLAEHGYQGAPHVVAKLAGDDADSAKPILMQMGATSMAQYAATERFADPMFVPKLKAALGKGVDPALVYALAECGDVETAVRAAAGVLKPAEGIEQTQALFNYFHLGKRYAMFLALQGGPEASDSLKKLLKPKHIAYLEERCDTLLKERAPAERRRNLNRWQQWVAAALVVCDPKAARPFLEEDFKSADHNERLFAAFALLAMGDERGLPTVEGYVARATEYGGEVPLTVVRSERTDKLLMKRFANGINYHDAGLMPVYRGYGKPGPCAFATDHAASLLPLLLRYLDSDDWKTHQAARMCLGAILDVQREPMPHPASDEQLRQDRAYWHEQVEKFLAEQSTS